MIITAMCRESCHQKYRQVIEQGIMSREVETVVWQAGGLNKDVLVDVLGYEHHICDLEDGRIFT